MKASRGNMKRTSVWAAQASMRSSDCGKLAPQKEPLYGYLWRVSGNKSCLWEGWMKTFPFWKKNQEGHESQKARELMSMVFSPCFWEVSIKLLLFWGHNEDSSYCMNAQAGCVCVCSGRAQRDCFAPLFPKHSMAVAVYFAFAHKARWGADTASYPELRMVRGRNHGPALVDGTDN